MRNQNSNFLSPEMFGVWNMLMNIPMIKYNTVDI